jgi:hypothetical protein
MARPRTRRSRVRPSRSRPRRDQSRARVRTCIPSTRASRSAARSRRSLEQRQRALTVGRCHASIVVRPRRRLQLATTSGSSSAIRMPGLVLHHAPWPDRSTAARAGRFPATGENDVKPEGLPGGLHGRVRRPCRLEAGACSRAARSLTGSNSARTRSRSASRRRTPTGRFRRGSRPQRGLGTDRLGEVDDLTSAPNQWPCGPSRTGTSPAIDVGREPPVQPHLVLEATPASLERRESSRTHSRRAA